MAYYPNYYNNLYPYGYQPTQSYATNNLKSMEWVDGEVGAKAFQMPQGWPPETPIVLWDNSEKRIFLKSWNQMGMANPMQELEYTIKERTNPNLLPNVSGDTVQYATKEDLAQLKQEIRNMMNNRNNENRNGGGTK